VDIFYIIEVGVDTIKGDIILSYGHSANDIDSIVHKRSSGGKIIKIEVFSNVLDKNIPKIIRPIYEKTKMEYVKKYGEYPIGRFYDNGEKFSGIMIKFTISQVLQLKKGDKLNNRHFNKGVVSIIEKKENMPLTPWGERIQIIYNPLAIINRMITGQVMELHSGLISKRLAVLMGEKKRKEFIDILKKVMDWLDGSDKKVYSSNLINFLVKVSDIEYKKIVDKITKNGFFPLIFTPFKSPPRENILLAMKYLGLKARYELYVPEFDAKTDPVPVGYIYVMKLEHMSEKKLHARGTGAYISKSLAPVRGKRRGGGQRFGEYESYSLISWNSPHIVDEMMGPLSIDHVAKNEIISEIIRKGTAKFRLPKTNQIKDIMVNTLLSVNLNILGDELYNYLEKK